MRDVFVGGVFMRDDFVKGVVFVRAFFIKDLVS